MRLNQTVDGDASMALITLAVLAEAARVVDRMNLDGRVRLVDEVFAHQPNLLASVLVLQRFGVSLPHMDVPIHILLVSFRAMKDCGQHWPVISEATQEACLHRLTSRIRFAEGLGPELLQQAVQQSIDQHSEPHLLAFAYGQLRDHDLLACRTDAEKHLQLATFNLVVCIGWASAQIQRASL
jgi:hypothetical protein